MEEGGADVKEVGIVDRKEKMDRREKWATRTLIYHMKYD